MVIFVFAIFCWLAVPLTADIPAVAAMPWIANVNDTSVAVLVRMLIFMVPASKKNKGALLSWTETSEVPWGVLIVVGCGMALPVQISASGLSPWTVEQMVGLQVFPP